MQDNLKPEKVAAEILKILRDAKYTQKIRSEYATLKMSRGGANRVLHDIAAAVISHGAI
jgi:UDP:flavonoid glycosyltransferase YjiC (YdhE family)